MAQIQEYSHAQIKAKFHEMFSAKTIEEYEQIKADFLKGKDDEFIEAFHDITNSARNDFIYERDNNV